MVFTATGQAVTVKVLSAVEALQPLAAAIVYLIVTLVLEAILAGVYVFPEIVPPPETTDQVPPEGEPTKVFVWFSVIEAVFVVLEAVVQIVKLQLVGLSEGLNNAFNNILWPFTSVLV